MLLARVTTIVPLCLRANSTFYALTSIRQLLCLTGVEAVKLAQAAFGDFLADICVRKLKGERDGNKEVYFVDTVPDTNKAIVNIKL